MSQVQCSLFVGFSPSFQEGHLFQIPFQVLACNILTNLHGMGEALLWMSNHGRLAETERNRLYDTLSIVTSMFWKLQGYHIPGLHRVLGTLLKTHD